MKMFNAQCVFLLFAASGIYGSRVLETHGVQTVLAVQDEDVVISCEDNVPMSYCGFTHPNGTRYSFAGANLNSGQCLVNLRVMKNDSGRWTCHIGRKDIAGEEITRIMNIRVGDKLVAVEANVTVNHGVEITLACTTSQKMQPLSYCRFVPPTGKAFSINSDITRNNSIKGRYYFPSNMSLDRGDCGVTIAKVKYEDVGLWACGAWLEDDLKEFVDVIDLKVEGFYTISAASVTGIVFGVIAVVILLSLVAFITWRRRSTPVVPQEAIEIRAIERSRSATPQPQQVPMISVQSPSDGESSPTSEEVARQE